MPQRACLSVLNQPHEGLQGSQTSGATAPIRVCPQSRGTKDHTDPAVHPVHVRALVPNPIWAPLGPWHRPGKVASLFLLSPHSHIFPFLLTPRGGRTIPSVVGNQSTASLPGFLCADGASWAEGWEEGPPSGLPGCPAHHLPSASPSCTSFTQNRVREGHRLFSKRPIFMLHLGRYRRFCGKLGDICSLVTTIYIT